MSPQPGTTRDAIDSPFTWEGVDYVLVDTAGLRRPSHVDRGLERQMVLKTIKALSRAEVAVLMLDAAEGLTGQDLRIIGLIEDQGKGCLVLMNKWDLVRRRPEGGQDPPGQSHLGAGIHGLCPGFAGVGPHRLQPEADFSAHQAIHTQSGTRVGTGVLNRLLTQITDRVPPPRLPGPPAQIFLPHPGRSAPAHLRRLRQPAPRGAGPLPPLPGKAAAGEAGAHLRPPAPLLKGRQRPAAMEGDNPK